VKRALVGCALLIACQASRIQERPPHVQLDATSIDFGATPVLFPVQRTLLVESVGFATLHVTPALTSGGNAFSLSTQPLELAPGATVSLAITFLPPDTGSFSGSLSLSTDDPTQPLLTVSLTGVGTQPGAVLVSPKLLDFGRVGEGQTATRALTVQSLGPADLYLDALEFAPGTPPAFGFVGSVSTPAVLQAGKQLSLAVHFSPTPDTQVASGAAHIDTSDPTQPSVLVPLVASINRAPIAVATAQVAGQAPQAQVLDAQVGALVQLDASGSSDPDGDLPLSFQWSLDERPQGSSAFLSSTTAAQPTLQLDTPGIYSLTLVAFDATGLQSLSPARLAIQALPPVALVVELVWDQIPPDLDLHFLQHGAAVDSAQDCYWANPDPAFGAHHGGDDLVGYGPEVVQWRQPTPGSYDLDVVYISSHGAANASTNAQLRIFSEGVLSSVLTHSFAQAGEAWSAGTLTWPGGNVTGASP
jgi:hypothetical protein